MISLERRALLPLLALAAVAVASCTAEEVAAPTSADTQASSTSSTTTSTTPAPTTTDDVVDVIATDPPVTDAVASTDAPPVTFEAPSGRPTSNSTLVFAGGAADGWFHMGRWSGNAWEGPIEADGTLRTPSITSGDSLTIHELDAAPVEGTVGAGASVCSDDRVGPTISPDPGAPDTPDFGYRSIAFPADWNTQPRPVALVDADIAAYVDAGQAVFADADTSSGTVKQIVVSDLDGDGDTEALVAFGGPSYSTLLLINTETRTALTVARSIAEVTVPTTAAAGDPTPDSVTGTFSRFRTMVVTDANGDGLMEFVVHSWENGAATATLYSYDGSEVSTALTASC